MSKSLIAAALAACLLPPTLAAAQTGFDGTWKSTPQSTKMSKKPFVMRLKDGVYTCLSCAPAYTVPADGADHAISGSAYFDTVAITVVDDHTVKQVDKKAGKTVETATRTISPDGKTQTFDFVSTVYGAPMKGRSTMTRIAAGAPGSHALAGSWREAAIDSLSDAALTETLRLADGALTCTTPLGFAFTASIGGADAPAKGDPGVTAVSVRQLGPATIVETDLHDGKVVGIVRRILAKDGTSIAVSYLDKRQNRAMSWTGNQAVAGRPLASAAAKSSNAATRRFVAGAAASIRPDEGLCMPACSRLTLHRAVLLAAFAALSLAGCADRPTDPAAQADFDQTNDPYEPANRFFYKVNDALDAVVLRPAAIAYVNVLPAPARTGVHNLLQNLNSPVQLGNDLLQGSVRRSGTTLARFAINSTVGVGGLFDVATGWGYPYQATDFGITLALWGLGEGPFLYLPVLGPSNPRDALGYAVDAEADPLDYIGKGETVTELRYIRFGVYAVDERSDLLGTLSSVKKTALDPYATLRSLYRQNRQSAIRKTREQERGPTPPTAVTPTPASNPPAQ